MNKEGLSTKTCHFIQKRKSFLESWRMSVLRSLRSFLRIRDENRVLALLFTNLSPKNTIPSVYATDPQREFYPSMVCKHVILRLLQPRNNRLVLHH